MSYKKQYDLLLYEDNLIIIVENYRLLSLLQEVYKTNQETGIIQRKENNRSV